jgi:CheY-like chemotaxis protein
MGAEHLASHAAFLYATPEAYFAHLVDFVADGARGGERMLVVTSNARWDELAARLDTARIDWRHATQRGMLFVADVETILTNTVIDGIFERARFDAALTLLLAGGDKPQRVYGDAAGTLAARDNLPACLALECLWTEFVQHSPTARVCCGYDVRHFPDAEPDWPIRSVLNAHHDAQIEPGAWPGHVCDVAKRTSQRRELILLWDDYPDTCNMYAEALTFSGYRVITAADAARALALAIAYRPDLIILDVRLPRKVGVTTMQTLRTVHSFRAPILALTAHAFSGERAEIFDAGFDGILLKPCPPHAVVAAVTQALAGPLRVNDTAFRA